MQTISLCMIAKNEEKFLEQCLNSVKGLVDEIIIVDTGSSDKTKEIAAKFTDKIYDFEWCNDFSAARNKSLRYAASDWIFVLDADETIAKEDHSKIKSVINSTDAVGFLITQRNYTDESHAAEWISAKNDKYTESKIATGWFPIPIIRLFKNSKNVVYTGPVHEKPDDSLTKIGKLPPPLT